MERGLLWLPLLITFIWLAWTGWQEYQKIEAYRIWAEQFDKAKYDIYAVLGQKDDQITWGKSTRKGFVDIKTFSLKDVQAIRLLVEDRPVDWDHPPAKGKVCLEFSLVKQSNSIQIPFTDISLAAKWGKYLQQKWEKYRLK